MPPVTEALQEKREDALSLLKKHAIRIAITRNRSKLTIGINVWKTKGRRPA